MTTRVQVGLDASRRPLRTALAMLQSTGWVVAALVPLALTVGVMWDVASAGGPFVLVGVLTVPLLAVGFPLWVAAGLRLTTRLAPPTLRSGTRTFPKVRALLVAGLVPLFLVVTVQAMVTDHPLGFLLDLADGGSPRSSEPATNPSSPTIWTFLYLVPAGAALRRHFNPLLPLKRRKYVLFLRRFHSPADRSLAGPLMAALPAGWTAAWLFADRPDPLLWDPSDLVLSGLRASAPFASAPTVLRTTDAHWQADVGAMISAASAIVIDVSEESGSLREEMELVEGRDAWSRTILLVGDGHPAPALPPGATLLNYSLSERDILGGLGAAVAVTSLLAFVGLAVAAGAAGVLFKEGGTAALQWSLQPASALIGTWGFGIYLAIAAFGRKRLRTHDLHQLRAALGRLDPPHGAAPPGAASVPRWQPWMTLLLASAACLLALGALGVGLLVIPSIQEALGAELKALPAEHCATLVDTRHEPAPEYGSCQLVARGKSTALLIYQNLSPERGATSVVGVADLLAPELLRERWARGIVPTVAGLDPELVVAPWSGTPATDCADILRGEAPFGWACTRLVRKGFVTAVVWGWPEAERSRFVNEEVPRLMRATDALDSKTLGIIYSSTKE